ncbi:MAG: hypothetical protein OQJ91_15430 [Motiliproteus sp.]|nr:hypothetical protein [Motiliproteus sp.]
MNKLIPGLLICLMSSVAIADTSVPAGAGYDPAMERLQAMQQMRLRLEQDMADYLNSARANGVGRPVQPADSPTLREMRQDVAANMERLEDRFRCLDVDIQGNNGNVVLVCGDNHGPVSTNNQQAFGADLNVSGGAR